jgi:hypothetical protein
MNRRATGRSRRFSQRTSSSAFSLGTVTGITNWWVSTAGVTVDVGDVVSAWTDQIGSDLLAAAGVARPNYVANAVNGLPAIDCAAAGQLLNDLTATSHLASVSVVAVVSIGGGNTGWRFDTNSSQHQLTILPATVLTGPARAAGYHVVIYCFGASGGFGTALDTRIIEVDGVAGTLGATAVNLAQGTTAFTIGGNGSTPKVAEIGYFNGTILSAGQRAAIASGLRAKYGI